MTRLAVTPTPTGRRRLTDEERSKRDRLHARYRQIAKETAEGIQILTEIGVEELWAETHDSFNHYLADEWGMHIGHVWRKVESSKLVALLPPDLPVPFRESTTRPMLKIADEPELVGKVYRAAVDAAGGGIPTARQVEAEVAKVKPKPPKAGSADEAKARGVIPPGAVIEVVEPAENDGITHCLPQAPLSDPEWLLTLPARKSIPEGFRRERFDADALFYRHTEELRDGFRRACTGHAKAAEKPNGGHRGRYLERHYGFLRVEAPEWWQACGDCKGTCQTLVGECPSCRGAGYQLK